MDGPKSVLANLDNAEGSHYEFLGCDSIQDAEATVRQVTRIVCMNDSAEEEASNCAELLVDGVEGKVARLPWGCGPGNHVVVRSLSVSENQQLPASIASRKRGDSPVMDLAFDFNFPDIKKSPDGEITMRLDFSTVPQWAADAAPMKPKPAAAAGGGAAGEL
ncbi:hypothetical protein FN846DRAFT_955457, partial [Sphaerosporella brunnea]